MTKIIIDPGHGGSDPGAQSFGIKEKDWTLEVSIYQYKRLKALGVPVALTRDKDLTLDPNERTAIVRNSGADYCISNHFNAGGGSGVETIHSIYSNDKLAKKIAEAITKEGMPFRRVFSRKGNSGKDYYYMHRETGQVKTIIIEYGFLDSESDFKRLDSKAEREKYAEAVVKVICEWLGYAYHAGEKKEAEKKVTEGSLYKVQIGAFRHKENAERLAEKLKKEGYPVYITGN